MVKNEVGSFINATIYHGRKFLFGVEEILLEVLLETRKIYVCSLEFRFDALDFQKLI